MNLKMKIDKNLSKNNEKPIKYKEFIQELHNSSRSLNNDQSILSQRSFRQSSTFRENSQFSKRQNNSKNIKKTKEKINNMSKNEYVINNPHVEQTEQNEMRNKLYTFCDAKFTQKSVEFVCQSTNHQAKCGKPDLETCNRNYNQNNLLIQPYDNPFSLASNKSTTKKYFKANKQNIDFVSDIIHKGQAGFQGKGQAGFQGKVLKTQTQVQGCYHNIQRQQQGRDKMQILGSGSIKDNFMEICANSSPNSHKEIQSYKKIFSVARKSINSISKVKLTPTNSIQKLYPQILLNKQNSPQTSNLNHCSVNKAACLSMQQDSSKKKIISLNINPLKPASNKVKLKLCLQKSLPPPRLQVRLPQPQSLQSPLSPPLSTNQPIHLQQPPKCLQPIQPPFLMFSGQKDEQNYRMSGAILQAGWRQLEIGRKLKQSRMGHQSNQTDILRRDCARLNNSYRQIKQRYQVARRDVQQLQQQNADMQQEVRAVDLEMHVEMVDLRQCLAFKTREVDALRSDLRLFQQHVAGLEQQLERNEFPSELAGLSQMVKEKIAQYSAQIDRLNEENLRLSQENEKLITIRQKLESFTIILKQEIQEKDQLIFYLEKQQKEVSQMRRSFRDEVIDHRVNQNKLTKILKQLESKLKLSNIHNQYLTKQLLFIKSERKQNPSADSSPMLHKFASSNTITTRNSSISHARQKFDTLTNHNLNQELNIAQQNHAKL